MQQLTNEEIEKLSGLYIGCDVIGNISGKKARLGTINEITIALLREKKVSLLLTPISKISDEHALFFCKERGTSGYTIFNHKERSIANIKEIFQKGNYTTIEFQRLIKMGYAVELDFGVGHWANGKTAIESGIGIDKTTL